MKNIFKILDQPHNFTKQRIKVMGWIKYNRFSSKIGFISLNDGTTIDDLQIVYKLKGLKNFAKIAKLPIRSAIKVEGQLEKSHRKAEQKYEFQAVKITLIQRAESDYPLQKKAHRMDFFREKAHLRIQNRLFQAIHLIRNSAIQAIHTFFAQHRFYYLQAPIITQNDCEGGGEAFFVNDQLTKKWFFGQESRLTVSAQLHAEAFAQGLKQVYTFGPTFRAEKSNTRFHAAEFWMVEPEIAFAQLNEGIKLATKLLKTVAKHVLKNEKAALVFLAKRTNCDLLARNKSLGRQKFAQISYQKALEKLNQTRKEKLKFGDELSRDDERELTETIFQSPVVVFDYPRDQKAFYMKANSTEKTVRGFDILFPFIGEVVGGGERETDFAKIMQRVKELQLDITNLKWYLELRKYGYAPSVGFGLGFDRLLMYLTGIENIRDIVPFYQGFKSLKY